MWNGSNPWIRLLFPGWWTPGLRVSRSRREKKIGPLGKEEFKEKSFRRVTNLPKEGTILHTTLPHEPIAWVYPAILGGA